MLCGVRRKTTTQSINQSINQSISAVVIGRAGWRRVCVCVSLTGHSPFRGRTTDETYLNITQSTGVNLTPPGGGGGGRPLSEYARDWVTKLLVRDTRSRMTVAEALSHPWLSVSHEYSSALTTPLAARGLMHALPSFL